VNVAHFRKDAFAGTVVRTQLGIPADALVVGTIAVFRFQKRLDLWLELARKIVTRFTNVHFIIVGDGPLKEELMRKRKELSLEDIVHLVGLQTEVRPFLAAFDLYMMSSIFEGLPIALLEAMASGCPVVSTDAGGIKEVIEDGREGLLCPVNQPETLVDLALEMLNSQTKRSEFSVLARKRIENNFSMETMVQALEELYDHVQKTPNKASKRL
jgi:L-malate glycosyltransferase